jgi:hypothetical protein
MRSTAKRKLGNTPTLSRIRAMGENFDRFAARVPVVQNANLSDEIDINVIYFIYFITHKTLSTAYNQTLLNSYTHAMHTFACILKH